jgi:hypothetical protein
MTNAALDKSRGISRAKEHVVRRAKALAVTPALRKDLGMNGSCSQ